MKIIWSLLVSLIISVVESYRILSVMPIGAESHHGMVRGILRALAGAGHHVISYTPFPMDKPIENYTEIQIENTWSSPVDRANLILEIQRWHISNCFKVNRYFENLIYKSLSGLEIQSLLNSKEKFDLIITEQTFGAESLSILGHIFKSPTIGIQTFVTHSYLNSLAGNTLSISHIPDVCSPFSSNMNFVERSLNAYRIFKQLQYYYYDYLPTIETKMRRMFPGMPPLLDLVRSTSLYFVNDHQTADYSMPRTPNIVPIGGIHIQPIGRLPNDLQRFMDEAEEGVILYSLGTYVPDELQTKEYFETYLGAFRRLKQRVIWKSRKTYVEGIPDNVLVRTWLPQQEILAHQKCVLFVTHGGQSSTLEALHYGVPIIAIPQFADQIRNAVLFEAKEVGMRLKEVYINQESLYKTLKKVIDDKRYSHNMARLSAVFRDRPQSAAQSVVYWVEYVIRHAGAPHLRPVATTMPWYQRASVDVAAAFILILVTMLMFSCYLVFRLCKLLKMSTNAKKIEKLK